ncbi:MAG: 2-hydroxyhepta-2,4-diene,7-dioate isomerase [Bryobacterales bacterium]|jgi:2-dehydro-3-deoxy-D-arabinonate dehydratase|nr:2-hydroxyhepta-2,4-diene,7-dioate isomerase [Bryobacterales bacterium]
MKLLRTTRGFIVEENEIYYSLDEGAWTTTDWDALLARDDLYEYLNKALPKLKEVHEPALGDIEAPIGNQEVWAAGVTYYKSRDARVEESKSAGGGDFYQRVYDAERPELFLKATPHRVVGPDAPVAIRADATWSVPEPELALLVTPSGKITGYTIGNDMSSRDIEGENPLYLPQAKVYDRSCALGPAILVSENLLPPSTEIRLDVLRGETTEFSGSTTLESLRRTPEELVRYLYTSNRFPAGCFLLTGTGIIPPDAFALQNGDQIRITITGIGTLINSVG